MLCHITMIINKINCHLIKIYVFNRWRTGIAIRSNLITWSENCGSCVRVVNIDKLFMKIQWVIYAKIQWVNSNRLSKNEILNNWISHRTILKFNWKHFQLQSNCIQTLMAHLILHDRSKITCFHTCLMGNRYELRINRQSSITWSMSDVCLIKCAHTNTFNITWINKFHWVKTFKFKVIEIERLIAIGKMVNILCQMVC